MQLQQQFEVSNLRKGVVVVTPDPEKTKTYLRFEGKGDEDGGDKNWVSRDTLQRPEMVKAVQRGVLAVEVDPHDPLTSMLRVLKKHDEDAPEPPLTALRVVYGGEDEEYKSQAVQIPVYIDPPVKVYG